MKKILIILSLLISGVFADGVNVYKGSSNGYGDILLNVKDGKIYKGSSNGYGDIIANVSSGKIYNGTSNSYSDISFNYQGFLTLEEFIAVWFALKYMW